jgi:hypothetical protein
MRELLTTLWRQCCESWDQIKPIVTIIALIGDKP